MIDVAVIGGGPAGAASAIHLARAGAQVTLFEKKIFPRPKLCGGFLSAEALPLLERLGVREQMEADGWPLRRALISAPGGAVAEIDLPSPGLSVDRSVMDALLLERARAEGVCVEHRQVALETLASSPMTVVASGRAPKPGTAYYGIHAFFDDVPALADQVELHLLSGGYVGLSRQTKERVTLCALLDAAPLRAAPTLDELLKALMRANPLLARRLRDARRVSVWQAVGPVVMGMRRLTQGRALFVGDAACVVDPFFGEGMAMALHGAQCVGRAWRSSAQDAGAVYENLWKRSLGHAVAIGSLLRRALGSRRRQGFVVSGFKKFPSVMQWLNKHSRVPDSDPYEYNEPHPNRRAV